MATLAVQQQQTDKQQPGKMNLPIQIPSQVVPLVKEDASTAPGEAEKISMPQLPPPPPKQSKALALSLPRRARQYSEPVTSPSDNSRRSIFGQFWRGRRDNKSSSIEKDPTLDDQGSATPSPPTRQRSISVSAIPESPEDARLCVEFFSPPVTRSVLDDHDYFLPLDRLAETSHMLPVLPMPLRRFYADGKSSPLQGMYPLVAPKSILRKKASLDSDANPSNSAERSQQVSSLSNSWNLTKTNRHMHHHTDNGRALSSFSSDSSHSSSSHPGTRRRSVSFDPRVTITEFEDSVPRQWFSEVELDRFRAQTVMRAQAYLMEHPEMIRVYQQPYLDPVTGTMRKKALFSLPCLTSTASDETSSSAGSDNLGPVPDTVDDDTEANTAAAMEARQRMAQHALEVATKQHVQNVLIVDRNTVILDLFTRSLRHIFPHAQIVVTESSQKALSLFRKELIERKRGFDVVIAEEALNVPLPSGITGSPMATSNKSCPAIAEACPSTDSDAKDQTTAASASSDAKTAGKPAPATSSMTGSQLLTRVAKEAGMLTVPSQATPQGMVRAVSNPFTPLLVGVKSQSSDEEKLACADLIWEKPPPLMDEQLRNAMVGKLISKRSESKSLRSDAFNGVIQ